MNRLASNRFIHTFVGCIILLTTNLTASLQATSAKELEQKANIVREEGKSLQAIDLYNQAIVLYQEDQNYSGVLEALTGRLLSWKHLFYKTEDKIYAIFVKKNAEMMLEIAKEHRLLDRLFLIHYLNGQAATLFKDPKTAEQEFQKAVELFPFNNAEKGDWTTHLGNAMYENGKKEEGKKLILQGVQQIQEHASEIDSFRLHVWISGAYLRLAKLLKSDDIKECQLYFKKAKEIIDGDDRLVIRKQQLDAFAKTLNN